MDDVLMPAIFEHCTNTYARMRDTAQVVTTENSRMLVWEGFLTKLMRSLGLSTPYYTKVRRELVRMGCIRQLRRGGGQSASQWELVQTPTEELFKTAEVKVSKEKTNNDIFVQQLKDLNDRITLLEQHQIAIIDAINRSA